jgi:hypothetical protein
VSEPTPFVRTVFEAELHEVKFMPSGQMRVMFVIPEEEAVERGAILRRAYACGVMVTVERIGA